MQADVFDGCGLPASGTWLRNSTPTQTGPGWKGTLPEGITEYKSPTNMVWILGRTYYTGTPEDYKAVALPGREVVVDGRPAECLRQALQGAQGQG